jgi:2-haloacid dehalogenase
MTVAGLQGAAIRENPPGRQEHSMATTLAFDVYGTLIDTHGVVEKLEEMVGDRAREFSSTWRDKQLEYSFRRGLMQNYQNFAVCTRDALDYTCSRYAADITPDQKQALLDIYRELPAFADVRDALAELGTRNCRSYAFSNGSAEAVETLLSAAGIRDLFLGVVSCDDLRSFKPNPAVYAHFLRQTDARAPLPETNGRQGKRGMAHFRQSLRRNRRDLGRHACGLGAAFRRCDIRSLGYRADGHGDESA